METGGADRSEDLSWESSLNGYLGQGRSLALNTLTEGSHSITASWPGRSRSDSIFLRVNP